MKSINLDEEFARAAKPVERKCEKTMSGRHMFLRQLINTGGAKIVEYEYEYIKKCVACGIINDVDKDV